MPFRNSDTLGADAHTRLKWKWTDETRRQNFCHARDSLRENRSYAEENKGTKEPYLVKYAGARENSDEGVIKSVETRKNRWNMSDRGMLPEHRETRKREKKAKKGPEGSGENASRIGAFENVISIIARWFYETVQARKA